VRSTLRLIYVVGLMRNKQISYVSFLLVIEFYQKLQITGRTVSSSSGDLKFVTTKLIIMLRKLNRITQMSIDRIQEKGTLERKQEVIKKSVKLWKDYKFLFICRLDGKKASGT